MNHGTQTSFRCLRLRVELEARGRIELPAYKGSTLRGALGMALRKSCCSVRGLPCADCLLRFSCRYVYLFETPLAARNPAAARYRYAPHPFILQICTDPPVTLNPGECWAFDMTLIGRVTDWVPHLVLALQRMGTAGIGKGRGTFELKRLVSLDGGGTPGETLFEDGLLHEPRQLLTGNGSIREGASLSHDGTFRLRFLTPLRLVYHGELVKRPEFHMLMENLLRRLVNLDRFHCDGSWDIPVGRLLEEAQAVRLVEDRTRWYDWTRYSHRQRRKMRLGGLLGSAVYSGDSRLHEPYLTVGAWVNVGKATSFGLGRYSLENQFPRIAQEYRE